MLLVFFYSCRHLDDQMDPTFFPIAGDVIIFGGPARDLIHALLRVYPGTAPEAARRWRADSVWFCFEPRGKGTNPHGKPLDMMEISMLKLDKCWIRPKWPKIGCALFCRFDPVAIVRFHHTLSSPLTQASNFRSKACTPFAVEAPPMYSSVSNLKCPDGYPIIFENKWFLDQRSPCLYRGLSS